MTLFSANIAKKVNMLKETLMKSNQTNIENEFNNATFIRRLCALVYDSFVVFSFLILVTALALAINQGKSLLPHQTLFLAYLFISTGLLISWFWQKAGQTLGMLAWKIKVVDQNLMPLTWQKAFIRFCIATVCIAAGGLGLLWCLIDKNQLALHDKLSKTRVIRLPIKKLI